MARTRIFPLYAERPWTWRHDLRSNVVTHPGLGQEKQLCETLPRSNIALRSYDTNKDFDYVYTWTLEIQIWPGLRSWHTLCNCVKYYPDRTRWYDVIWLGQGVNRRTDRVINIPDHVSPKRTRHFITGQVSTPPPPPRNNNLVIIDNNCVKYHPNAKQVVKSSGLHKSHVF